MPLCVTPQNTITNVHTGNVTTPSSIILFYILIMVYIVLREAIIKKAAYVGLGIAQKGGHGAAQFVQTLFCEFIY